MTDAQRTELCRYCGVLTTDTDAVANLELCYQSAVDFYTGGGVRNVETLPAAHRWLLDLTSWFYDNRGGDKEIPNRYCMAKFNLIGGEGNGAVSE